MPHWNSHFIVAATSQHLVACEIILHEEGSDVKISQILFYPVFHSHEDFKWFTPHSLHKQGWRHLLHKLMVHGESSRWQAGRGIEKCTWPDTWLLTTWWAMSHRFDGLNDKSRRFCPYILKSSTMNHDRNCWSRSLSTLNVMASWGGELLYHGENFIGQSTVIQGSHVNLSFHLAITLAYLNT